MNVTDKDGLWRVTQGFIENRKTGEIRTLEHTPSANALAYMNYDKFLAKCQIAFNIGTWPVTHHHHWSCRVTD
jgi:hypothetical protein